MRKEKTDKLTGFDKEYIDRLNEKLSPEKIKEMVEDKNRVLDIIDISKIQDAIFSFDYKDTMIVPDGQIQDIIIPSDYKDTMIVPRVPDGRTYCFGKYGNLTNGKYDIPKLKAYGEKEKLGNLLFRRSDINRALSGETDCLNEDLTPQKVGKFERELEKTQKDIIEIVGPFINFDNENELPSENKAVEAENKPTEPLFNSNGVIVQESENKATEGNFGKNNEGIKLPPELDTPEAKKVFEKAIEKGYIAKTSTGYKWQKTKLDCAYFAYKATIEWNMVKRIDSNGNKCGNYKPFEKCFGINKLSEARANYMRLYPKFEPNCKNEIDAFF